MGEYMVPKTFKFPQRMLDRLGIEQGRLAPFARTESETLRLLLDFAFCHIDRGSLNDLLGAIQDLQRTSLSDEAAPGRTLDSSARREEGGLPAEKFRAGVSDCRQAPHFRPIQPTLFGFQVPKGELS